MTSMNWAYVAGFFDGEGCVGKYAHFHVSMNQAEPHDLVIYAIQDFLTTQGVESRVDVSHSGRRNHNAVHVLSLNKQSEVKKFLEGVLPFLIVKREKAEEVLAEVSGRLALRSQPHWRSSLHQVPVREVRRLWRLWQRGTTQEEIGHMLGISQKQVSKLFQIHKDLGTIPA